jgi:hypothetical protein
VALPLLHPKNVEAGTQGMDIFFKSGGTFLASVLSLFWPIYELQNYPQEVFGELWISYVSVSTIFKPGNSRRSVAATMWPIRHVLPSFENEGQSIISFYKFFQAAAQQTVCSTCYWPASTGFKYEVKMKASLVSFFEVVAQIINNFFTVWIRFNIL